MLPARRRRLRLLQQSSWTPLALGSKLVAWWDAERSDTITRSGGLVSSWRDVVGGYNMAQSSASLKPVYSATSFNGRPGLTFDGADDVLLFTGFPASFPAGADPSWMWGVADQQRANSVAGTGTVLQYGSGSTTNNTRRIVRVQDGGENRGNLMVGTGGSGPSVTNISVVFAGRHVILGKASGTTIECVMDGTGMTPAAVVPATTAGGNAAIGGAVNGGNFLLGVINSVLITLPLTTAEEALLNAYLNRRL